jgi:hypothetical protein
VTSDSRPLRVVVDTAAPTVTGSSFRPDLPTYPLTFTFSKDVGAGLAASALTLVNQTTGQTVDPAAMSMAYDPATRTATWTFPGLTSTGGRPGDGNYLATLAAPAIVSLAGVAMTTDYTFNFFVLLGDVNPQRPVYGGSPGSKGSPPAGTTGAA